MGRLLISECTKRHFNNKVEKNNRNCNSGNTVNAKKVNIIVFKASLKGALIGRRTLNRIITKEVYSNWEMGCKDSLFTCFCFHLQITIRILIFLTKICVTPCTLIHPPFPPPPPLSQVQRLLSETAVDVFSQLAQYIKTKKLY